MKHTAWSVNQHKRNWHHRRAWMLKASVISATQGGLQIRSCVLKVLPSLKERYKCQNNKFGRDYTAHTALLHVVYFSWKALYLNRASRPAASDSWSRCEPAGEKRWRNFTESGYFWQGFSFTHVNTKAPALPTLLFVYMHRHDRRLCAEEVKGDRQQTVEN